MRTGFIDQSAPENMQFDTFRLVTGYIFECQQSFVMNPPDPRRMERMLSCLLHLTLTRVKKAERMAFIERRDSIRDALYQMRQLSQQNLSDTELQSKILDEEERLFEDAVQILNDDGLLFRMKVDLSSIAAR